jgi:hypothetical protein
MGGKGSGLTSALAKPNGWLRPGGPLPEKVSGLTEAEELAYADLRYRISLVPWGGYVDEADVVRVAKLQVLFNRLSEAAARLPDDQLWCPNTVGGVKSSGQIADLVKVNNALAEGLKGLHLNPKSRSTTKMPASLASQVATTTPQRATGDPGSQAALLRLIPKASGGA